MISVTKRSKSGGIILLSGSTSSCPQHKAVPNSSHPMPRKPPSSASIPKPSDLISGPSTPLPTPALDSPSLRFSYTISRGETGVLTFEPYKSLILPYWRFRTVSVAQSSSEALWGIFRNYGERGDFVGMDMTRKFIRESA